MTHARKALRQAVAQRLDGITRGHETLTVYTNRVKEVTPDKLPAAVIVTDSEQSESYSKSGDLQRSVQCSVVVMVDADRSDDIDDELDDWAERIELALSDLPIGGAHQFTLRSTSLDIPSPEDGGATWIGFLILDYAAHVVG